MRPARLYVFSASGDRQGAHHARLPVSRDGAVELVCAGCEVGQQDLPRSASGRHDLEPQLIDGEVVRDAARVDERDGDLARSRYRQLRRAEVEISRLPP